MNHIKIRSYDRHKKKLKEIEMGKNNPLIKKTLNDPTLEESKMTIHSQKQIDRQFKATGNDMKILERIIKMERETKSLINRLDEIRQGKLVTDNKIIVIFAHKAKCY